MDKTATSVEQYMREHGYVWGPEPEMYSPTSGLYTYGPTGAGLKRNVESVIRQAFVSAGFFEVETPIIAPRDVWEGSGHLGGFIDWVIECSQCQSTYRADKLVEEKIGVHAGNERLLDIIQEHQIRCPSCDGAFTPELHPYHLMVRSDIGQRESYSRPETATMTYLAFHRYYQFFRKRFPIQVFQIGKAFRNELSPRQTIVRGREFTQAEAQIFVKPEEEYADYFDPLQFTEAATFVPNEGDSQSLTSQQALDHKIVSKPAYLWSLLLAHQILRDMGIPADRIQLRQHARDEMAHYALDAWDLEVYTDSLGWIECCGIHDRTDYDLRSHSTHGKDIQVVDDQTQEAFYPHVLEIAFGVDRPVYALIDMHLATETVKGEERVVCRLPSHIAPITCAVFPLVKKGELPALARQVHQQLLAHGIVSLYDESGSIGRRYRRVDEKGVPFAITVDYDSLEDNTVTVRYRDSMEQDRVSIEWLAAHIQQEAA